MTRDAVVSDLAAIREHIMLVEDLVALFDDIGWNRHGVGESYPLTLPDAQLVRIGRRLRATANALLDDELHGPFAGGNPDLVEQDRHLLRVATEMAGVA